MLCKENCIRDFIVAWCIPIFDVVYIERLLLRIDVVYSLAEEIIIERTLKLVSLIKLYIVETAVKECIDLCDLTKIKQLNALWVSQLVQYFIF